MAQAKYKKWLESDNLTRIAAWSRNGLSEKQIAHNMGIAYSTLRIWRDKYEALSAALKKDKDVVDFEVENALNKKALGHKVIVAKTFKCRRIEYNEEGRKIAEYDELVVGYDEVYVPPDTIAIMAWLKNRKPKEWRDKANEYQLKQLELELERIEIEKRKVAIQEERGGIDLDGDENSKYGVILLPDAENPQSEGIDTKNEVIE